MDPRSTDEPASREQGQVGMVELVSTSPGRKTTEEELQASGVDLEYSESFYHCTAYYFVLKANNKGNLYFFCLFSVLAFQLVSLLGFTKATMLSDFGTANTFNLDRSLLEISLFANNYDNGTELVNTLNSLYPTYYNQGFGGFDPTILDKLTLAFVCFVIAMNVVAELEEGALTAKLIHRDKDHPFRRYLMYITNYLRQYLLIMFVIGASAIVMKGKTASDIILSGLAIYSILAIDNMLYALVSTANTKKVLEEGAAVELTFEEIQSVKFYAWAHGAASLAGIMIASCWPDIPDSGIYYERNYWVGDGYHASSDNSGALQKTRTLIIVIISMAGLFAVAGAASSLWDAKLEFKGCKDTCTGMMKYLFFNILRVLGAGLIFFGCCYYVITSSNTLSSTTGETVDQFIKVLFANSYPNCFWYVYGNLDNSYKCVWVECAGVDSDNGGCV